MVDRPPLSTPVISSTAVFRSGESALRSRSVGHVVRTGRLALPPLPQRLTSDCLRETARIALEAGGVEPLSLARARMRWPGHREYLEAAAAWLAAEGLPEILADVELALMACRGARYHHDGEQYGWAAFCNLFLGGAQGQDLHFPAINRRIPIERGTIVLFDTCQPHAVIAHEREGFEPEDFGADDVQLFLSWELPVEDPRIAQALGIAFDTDPEAAARTDDAQLLRGTAPASLCPRTGRWLGGV